jgi:hypothetical protein
MVHHVESLWTLDELTDRAALALAVGYSGQPSGRVRDLPDRRTIRYYTTLGLLDRPAEMRGRTALYGQRHLRQLVAIKRLQVRGLSLADVQQRLLGLPDAQLAALAQVPKDIETAEPSARASCLDTPPDPRRESFWMVPPEPLNREGSPASSVATEHRPRATSLQAVSLAPDVTLLFPAARGLHADDIEAIQSAAAPLLKLLEKRRLRNSHP